MCLWKILYSFEIFVTTKILLLPIRLNVSLRVLPSYTFAKKLPLNGNFLHSVHISAATDTNEF